MSSLVPGSHATDPSAEPQNMVDLAQQVRLGLINSMTMNGNQLPTDPDSVKLLLAVLDGSDRSEINRMKIKADEKSGEADRQTALMLNQMFDERSRRLGGRNPFEVPGSVTIDQNYTPPAPDVSALPTVVPIPGQTDRGRRIESYDEFITRTGADTNGGGQ